MILTERGLAAEPLLRAIQASDDHSTAGLAARSGRRTNHIARDLAGLADAGLIEPREPGAPIRLTADAVAVLEAIDRANAPAAPGGTAGEAPGPDVPLHLIDADPDLNPRTRFEAEALDELAQSVGERGVLQPILIRPSTEPGRYRVVAGARRHAAALAAGQFTIPAVIRELTDDQALEIALLENLQREDMNPLDEANAFRRIIDARMTADPDLSLKDAKEALAAVIKKTIRFIELRLELLELPPIKLAELQAGKLSVTDARKWLQSRPKAIELPDDQWLTVLEVAQYVEGRDHGHGPCHMPDQDQMLAIGDLTGFPNYLISVQPDYEEGVRSNLGGVHLGFNAAVQLALRFDGAEKTDLAGLISTLRERVLDADAAAAIPPGAYATPWLNGPFDLTPECLAAIEARKAEVAQLHANRQAAQAVQQQRLDLAQAHVRAVAARARGITAPQPDADFTAALDQLEVAMPVYLRGGQVVDQQGRKIIGDPDYGYHRLTAEEVARRTLFAVALNTAAGLATPEPVQEAEDVDNDDGGEDDDDGGDDLAFDDDQDEAEELAGDLAASLSADPPEYLKRLAGAAPAAVQP